MEPILSDDESRIKREVVVASRTPQAEMDSATPAGHDRPIRAFVCQVDRTRIRSINRPFPAQGDRDRGLVNPLPHHRASSQIRAFCFG
jgi:hypothetical protein